MEDKKITMPAVALRGLTILPGMVQHFDISREKSIRAIETAMMGNQKVYLVTQRHPEQETPAVADLYQMGTISRIKQLVKMPGGIIRVMVEGEKRAALLTLFEEGPYLEAEVEEAPMQEEQLTDTVLDQMQTIRQIFRENPDYVKLLSEPSIPKEERTKLLDTAFGTEAERYLVNFLKLLCERGILGEYSGCCEEFTRRYNVDHNIATAVVTSAVALTDEQMAALKDKLEKISGKTVTLTQKTDPTVLAGLKVELEGKQLDGTVKSRLDGLSRKLNELIV